MAVTFTEDEKKKLLSYLEGEMETALREVYEPLQAHRDEWEKTYKGEVLPRAQRWQSNVPIQMASTFTDAVTARILNTLWAYKPFYKLTPTKNNEWVQVVKQVEEFLDLKVRGDGGFYNALRKGLFEAVRLGTGAILTPWVRETVRAKRRYLFWEGAAEEVVYNFVKAQHVPLRSLLFPGGFSELEELPWWARRLYWTPLLVEELRASGEYDIPDTVLKYEEQLPEAEQSALERAGEEPYNTRRIIAWDVWFKYKTKAGVKRYVATLHLPTRTVMRLEEDTYPRWPLFLFRYGPRDASLYGLGIVEVTKPYDDALHALYNLLIDNYKISTNQCLKVRKGTSLGPDTEVFPGKIFRVDAVDDVEAFALGQPFVLNPQFPRMIWDLGERRAGVSDYSLGRESPIVGHRATATATMALIQEGQRRFDLVISDIREELARLGLYVLEMMQTRLDKKEAYLVFGEKGEYVEKYLTLPNSPARACVKVNVASVAMNKEVAKQDAMVTYQLLSQHYQAIAQVMLQLANPNIPPEFRDFLVRVAQAATEKLKEVLEAYGGVGVEKYSDVVNLPTEEGGGGWSPPESQAAWSESSSDILSGGL